MRGLTSIVASAVVLTVSACPAAPLLQIYMEGGTYDAANDTWVVAGPSAGGSVRLWVIGNTNGPGSIPGPIEAVRLSVAYDSSWGAIPIGLQASTTMDYGGFTDPSTPIDPTYLGIQTGGTPTLSTGKSLPTHGVFGPNTTWQEFLLGDFNLNDSPVADFIDSFPTSFVAGASQINVYDVTVPVGYHGAVLHFDAYDHVEARNGAIFAPFSHDGQAPGGQENIVPEPSSIVSLLSMGALGLAAAWRRRR